MVNGSDLRTAGLVRGVHGDFFVPRDDLIAQQIRTFGAHTRPEIAMVRHFVKQGGIVIDIGAHIGTFAVPLAYSVGWAGRVFAFEPNPASLELLQLNVVLNGLQRVISVSSLAMSAGTADYYVVDNRTANSGASHLSAEMPAPPTPQRRATDRGADHAPGRGPYHPSVADLAEAADVREPVIAVAATSLDTFLSGSEDRIEDLNLIKIDVEGMEEAVIAGACATIENCRPAVYFEVAIEQARRFGLPDLAHIDYLQSLGYQFFRNVGARNAATDDFKVEPVDAGALEELRCGAEVADLMALPVEMSLECYL